MLKFIKQHMSSIGNIEIYPLISFVIFFLFFLIVAYLVIKSDKKFITKMQNLPLEDSTKTADEYEVLN
jgi:cytochrome c oxidase cbb3-type subunit IV